MLEPDAPSELLPSLGHLVRGLSVIFWSLPAALVACVQTAQADYLRLFGAFPPVLTTAALVYGLVLLGRFRASERVWKAALDRARFFAVINLGLSPFLFWWSRVPTNAFFSAMTETLAVSGTLFLLMLNAVLRRLTAMLPDETLRHETLVFTRLNSVLLLANLGLLLCSGVCHHLNWPPPGSGRWHFILERLAPWSLWSLVLVTTAMTMALVWKTKETIFQSVFGGTNSGRV
jgi:hypothetical protein